MSCSSTNVSRALGKAYPAVFLAVVFGCVAAANQILLRSYDRVEGRLFGRAWLEKRQLFEARRAGGAPLNSVYAGDSTVDVGIRMESVDPAGFNLSRTGFEPSRLPSLARLLLADPARKPRYILLSLTWSHLSEDAWVRPGDVPTAIAAVDAARLYYADSNSFRPLLCGGCSYLTTVAEKAIERLAPRSPAGASDAPWKQATPTVDLKLRVREANFALIERFKRDLEASGTRVVWIYLPARSGFLASFESSDSNRAFAQHAQRRIGEIFGPDVVDLRHFLDDRELVDDVHAGPEGARRQSAELGRVLAARYPGFSVSR